MSKTLLIVPDIFYVKYFLSKKNSFEVIYYDKKNIFFESKILKLYNFKRFAYLFSILKIILDFFIFFKVFKLQFKKKNFDNIIVEGIYPTLYLEIYKLFNNFKFKYIYWCSDFLISKKSKQKKILSHLANNFIFPKLDILFINNSKFSICSSNYVIRKKKLFYYNKINKDIHYLPFPYISSFNNDNKILNKNFIFTFFGVLRDISIYKIFIENLSDIIFNKVFDKKIFIKFIGPYNNNVKDLKNFCLINNFNFVEFHGFLNSRDIDSILEATNVGIFLQDKVYHSSFAIPSKIFKYFEHNIPIFTTPNNYEINSIFNNHNIGVMCNNSNMKAQIKEIIINYGKYFNSLKKFNYKKKDFVLLINVIDRYL